MRITVEIPDELQKKLDHETSRRGEQGCSGIVEQALRLYFRHDTAEQERLIRVRRLRGTLNRHDALIEQERQASIRRRWRNSFFQE